MDRAIELSLETWYPEDHPLHLDPLHPAIALAGEAGELLNLYKKEKFKPGVSWWDCKHCGQSKALHTQKTYYCEHWSRRVDGKQYTPKILDELGDLWYYLRILAYQQKMKLDNYLLPDEREIPESVITYLTRLNRDCANFLFACDIKQEFHHYNFEMAVYSLQDVIKKLDYTLDELTELNYSKLKDGDNHGWADTN